MSYLHHFFFFQIVRYNYEESHNIYFDTVNISFTSLYIIY